MQRWHTAGGGMVIAILATTGPVLGQTTERVSVSVSGAQAIGGRYQPRPSVSSDGSTVAFESPNATLVPGDTNSVADIFVVAGGVVTRVTAAGGVQTTCSSQRASVSATGQFVTFDSCASNLVAGDTNSTSDVFLLDRNTGTVTRVSVSSTELQGVGGPSYASAISPNGQFVAFLSGAVNLDGAASGTNVYLRDIAAGNTPRLAHACRCGVVVRRASQCLGRWHCRLRHGY
jgi:Tol biopolymer transport system component